MLTVAGDCTPEASGKRKCKPGSITTGTYRPQLGRLKQTMKRASKTGNQDE